jgi:hypothetical protein
LLAFSYWTGELPEISRLHFLTVAKALSPESQYILFIEKASLSSSMLALLGRCRVYLVTIDLPQLMQENGLGKLLRRSVFTSRWRWVQRTLRDHPRLTKFSRLGHYHSTMHFTPRYNLLLGSPPVTGVRLSDYVRVLISSLMPTHTLYMDIDFAFPRPLEWIYRHGSFVYDWERRGFANSALMSVREDSPIKTGALIDLLKYAGTAVPWILFSQENCRACGLEILPCDRLDPAWSKSNRQKVDEFFTRRHDSDETFRELQREFDAIHWHNRWQVTPEPGSPYDLWLRELTSSPLHQANAETLHQAHAETDTVSKSRSSAASPIN